MKFNFSLILAILFTSFVATAQNTNILHDGDDYTEIIFQFDQPTFKAVNTPNGEALVPMITGTVPMQKKLAPDLVSKAVSVLLPQGAIATLEVIATEYLDLENKKIAPSKGNLKRNINPNEKPYLRGELYNLNAFWPANIAEMGSPYTLRESKGLALKLMPLQYNPVTKSLRAYSSIHIKINYTYPNGVSYRERRVSKDLASVFRRHFINYTQAKYTAVGERAKLLIVTPANFITTLQPYILWKQQIGYNVEVVDYATIGSADNLKQYIADSYQNSQTGYVLLVGDHQQIPAFLTQYQYSDTYYGMVDGDDWYPEVFVGRFSAEDETQLNTMVNRVIRYEKFPDAGGDWYSKGICIASSEGPGDNNEMDWEHQRLIGEKLLGYTYSQVSELFDGSQGGNDANDNPNANDVAVLVESGVSIINYSGHGWEEGIATTEYSNANVENLNNTNKYPFFISVACVNGNFTDVTCFAEQWLRATDDNGNPAGAINALMATVNQSWNPPMSGQDEMINILTDNNTGFYPKTVGCITANGMMKMNDDYTDAGFEMTATWVNFGDPTTMVRTATPTALVVNHDSNTPLGTASLTFTCTTEGATVSITQNGVVLGSGVVNGGTVTITIDPIATLDSLEIIGFSFNTVPYNGEITILPNTGPFVSNLDWGAFDLAGGLQQTIDYNDSLRLHFNLDNIGNSLAENVQATLNTNDDYITITDNSATFGDIQLGENSGMIDAFGIKVALFIPNGHVAQLTVNAIDAAGNTWNFPVSLTINAPVLIASSYSFVETTGNQNGILENGETADITVELQNQGGSASPNIVALLGTSDSFVTINQPTNGSAGVANAGSQAYTFSVNMSNNSPNNAFAHFTFSGVGTPYGDTLTFSLPVNQVLETFESNDFNDYSWTMNGVSPWVTTNQLPYEGQYCSKSGAITDNQSSALQIQLNVAANDSVVFYYRTSCEEGYDFLKFYINGAVKGSWSGNIGWTRAAYAIAAGQRTLKWVYQKDDLYLDNEDAVFVDNIRLPQEADTTSSIAEIRDMLNFQILPNPASESVKLVFGENEKLPKQISLINNIGQEVFKKNIGNLIETDLSLAGLAIGIYTVKVTYENKININRLVVK